MKNQWIPLNSFHARRGAIGVTIERNGVFPEDGTENAHLIESAAHECLTNLVRHANGTRLEFSAEATANGWRSVT